MLPKSNNFLESNRFRKHDLHMSCLSLQILILFPLLFIYNPFKVLVMSNLNFNAMNNQVQKRYDAHKPLFCKLSLYNVFGYVGCLLSINVR